MKNIAFTLFAIITFGASAQDSIAFYSEPDDGQGVMKRYVSVPMGPNSTLQLNGDWTIEAWVKPPAGYTVDEIHIVESYSLNSADGGYVLRIGDKKVLAYVMSSTNQYSLLGATILPEDEWSHIAATYNETTGTFSVFVNGVGDITTTLSSVDQHTNTTGLQIGARGDDQEVLQAVAIDEVRIWNIARSEVEIQSTMNMCLSGNENGLVAYYDFEDAGGATLNDGSGNQNSGTVVNDIGLSGFVDGVFTCTANTNGIESLSQESVTIAPNPVTDYITLNTEGTIEQVEIYNLSGAIVQQGTSATLMTGSLESGIYIVNITTNLGSIQKRFLKR